MKKNVFLYRWIIFFFKKILKRLTKKRKFRGYIFIKYNYFLSKKNKNARMGKGKSNKGYWIIRLKRDNKLFFFKNFNILRINLLKKKNFYLYVDCL